MSDRAVGRVMALQRGKEGELKHGEKLVLISLANAYNHKTGRCDPGQDRIAREALCSVGTVQRHTRSLEKQGLIKRRTKAQGYGKGSKTYYELDFLGKDWASENDPDGSEKTSETGQDRPGNLSNYTRQSAHVDPSILTALYKDKPEIDQKRRARDQARASFAATNSSTQAAAELILEILEAIHDSALFDRRLADLCKHLPDVTHAEHRTLFFEWVRPLDEFRSYFGSQVNRLGIDLKIKSREQVQSEAVRGTDQEGDDAS